MDTWVARAERPTPPYERLQQQLEQLLQRAGTEDRWQGFTSVKKYLEREAGPWAHGWCWGEINGGPVTRWCCYDHSFLKGKPEEEPALTVSLVLGGLRDWESTLNECEALFARLPATEPIDLDLAVLEIVNFAVGATAASDAWYGFCIQVLSWYLQSLGVSEKRADTYAKKAVAGQFESWSAPTEKVKEQVAETFRELAWRELERRRS